MKFIPHPSLFYIPLQGLPRGKSDLLLFAFLQYASMAMLLHVREINGKDLQPLFRLSFTLHFQRSSKEISLSLARTSRIVARKKHRNVVLTITPINFINHMALYLQSSLPNHCNYWKIFASYVSKGIKENSFVICGIHREVQRSWKFIIMLNDILC